MKPNETQLQQVKTHLLTFGDITSWTAIQRYHITRLSQYILILRRSGMNIKMTRVNLYNRWFGLYQLVE